MFAALLVCRTLCAVLQELHGGREGGAEGVGGGGLYVVCHLASSTLMRTLESAHNQKIVLNEGWEGGGVKKKIVILHLESSTNSSARGPSSEDSVPLQLL